MACIDSTRITGYWIIFFDCGLSLVGLGLAGPRAGAPEESAARAVINSPPYELEDRSLEGQRNAKLEPSGLPVLGLRGLAIVEAAPDELKELRTDQAGKDAARNRQGCKENSCHVDPVPTLAGDNSRLVDTKREEGQVVTRPARDEVNDFGFEPAEHLLGLERPEPRQQPL